MRWTGALKVVYAGAFVMRRANAARRNARSSG